MDLFLLMGPKDLCVPEINGHVLAIRYCNDQLEMGIWVEVVNGPINGLVDLCFPDR